MNFIWWISFDELHLMNCIWWIVFDEFSLMNDELSMNLVLTNMNFDDSKHARLPSKYSTCPHRSILSLSFKAIFLVPAGTKAKTKSILTRTKTWITLAMGIEMSNCIFMHISILIQIWLLFWQFLNSPYKAYILSDT